MFDNLIEFEDNTKSDKTNIDSYFKNLKSGEQITSLEIILEYIQSKGILDMNETYFSYLLLDNLKKKEQEKFTV